MIDVKVTIQQFIDWEARLSNGVRVMLIVVASLAVKLGYITILGGGLSAFPSEGTDVSFYNAAAVSILNSGVYGVEPGNPTVGMPPGQPFFLAFLYAISGKSIVFAKLAHVALLTGVAVLTFFTAKSLAGASVGFWTGLLIAIDPAQAYLAGTFLSEPLFIFLMTLGIFLLLRERVQWNWIMILGAGVCFGLAGLVRNQGWLFAVALVLGSLVTRGWLMSPRAAAVVIVATAATIAPWTFRNYQLTGQFIPVSVEGGLTLWASNNPEFKFRPPMPMSLPIYDAPTNLAGPQIDQYYRQHALEWILSHPVDFTINGFRKLFAMYSVDPLSWRPEVAGLYRLAGIVPYGMMLPFIVLGLLKNLRQREFGIILWYILFSTVMAFLFYGDSRIRAPIEPYLYLFGVLGLQSFIAWFTLQTRLAVLKVNE